MHTPLCECTCAQMVIIYILKSGSFRNMFIVYCNPETSFARNIHFQFFVEIIFIYLFFPPNKAGKTDKLLQKQIV